MIWRFRQLEDFQLLRKQGNRYRSRAFTVVYAPADPELPPRFAFALGRHLGSAVRRNRLRRQLKAIAAASEPAGGFYLVRPQPAAMAMRFADLRVAFQDLLSDIERKQLS